MKIKSKMALFLIVLLVLLAFGGCTEKEFGYSDGLDKNGFYEKIRALDYVDLGDYTELSVPKEAYKVSDETLQAQIDAILANFRTEDLTPEFTDEFVARYLWPTYGFRTTDEMKEAIRSSIEGEALFDYMREHLIENMSIKSVPDSLIEYQKKSLIKTYQDSADFYKMELNDFLRVYVRVSSVERLIEKNLDMINDNAKFSLVIQAIAEDAEISVMDDDVTAYFEKHLESEDYEEYVDTYGIPYLKYITLQQAVMDYLVKNSAAMN